MVVEGRREGGRQADGAATAEADSPFLLKTIARSRPGAAPPRAVEPTELARALPLLRAANGGGVPRAARPIRSLPREVRRIADGNEGEYPPLNNDVCKRSPSFLPTYQVSSHMCVHFALDVIRGATNICSMVVECREKGVVVTEREEGRGIKRNEEVQCCCRRGGVSSSTLR